MGKRAEAIQRQVHRQREEILARARDEVALGWEAVEAEQEVETAERNATVEVERERAARREQLRGPQAPAPSDAPPDTTPEEGAEMATATTTRKRRPAAKGEEGIKAAQAHRATKAAQTGSAKSKRSSIRAAIKAGPPAGSENGAGSHAVRADFLAAAKKSGVRILNGSRGGFCVKVDGTNNQILRGVFATLAEAQAAVEAQGFELKGLPR